MMARSFSIRVCLGIAMLCSYVTSGLGQGMHSYPSRPVRFIIPFPPGGGTDVVGRVLGQKFADELGQPFVIDNRPGAAGTLGATIAAKAAPDGYTIMLASASFAISASYYKSLAYDPVKDFDEYVKSEIGKWGRTMKEAGVLRN